jgi:hypothetical protein
MNGAPALRDLQRAFADALRNPVATAGVAARIEARGLDADRRLQIYRNNLQANLTGALEDIYPAVRALVGERFFAALARRYIHRHPSRNGNLHAFGQSLPQFAADDEACAGLLYLADVATLEWLYHEVFHEADADAAGITALESFDREQYPNLRLRFHPATRPFESRFAVLDIWRLACGQGPAQAGRIDVDAGPCRLLVARRKLEMEFQTVSAEHWACLVPLLGGETLSCAYEAASRRYPHFDLMDFLGSQLGAGNVVGIDVAGSGDTDSEA